MLFNIVLLSALATTTFAFPSGRFHKRTETHHNSFQRFGAAKRNSPTQKDLPMCDADSGTCQCPDNSFYQTSSSYAFWPVPAAEIKRLTVDFLDSAWLGTSPEKVEGNGTVVGAKRYLSTHLPEAKASSTIVEEMTELQMYEDGGYKMMFAMADMPFWYEKNANGTWGLLAGSWDLVEVRNINGMAYMLWDIHVCFMDEYDLAGFHESGMKNLTSILKAEGVMPRDAEMIGPVTF